MIAVLPNGTLMQVHKFAEEGHNGVALTGTIEGVGECLLVAHQTSLQLLCMVQRVKNGEARRPIGFEIGGKKFET